MILNIDLGTAVIDKEKYTKSIALLPLSMSALTS